MAAASSRVLTFVSGSVDNTKPHYAFVRNGKQYIACVRKGWCRELHTDQQKITALRFAYATAISNMLSAAEKAARNRNLNYAIGYTYHYITVGNNLYFYDETLFTAINAVFAVYFSTPKIFVPGDTFTDKLGDEVQLYTLAPLVRQAVENTGKTAFRYAFTSILMDNAARIDLPNLYRDLAQCEGAQFDVYPKKMFMRSLNTGS